jgi:tetratricopeptide (TPR) repeat protein
MIDINEVNRLVEEKKTNEAISILKDAVVSSNFNNLDYILLLKDLLVLQSNVSEAKGYLDKYLLMNPTSALVTFEIGTLLYLEGNFEEAAFAFENVRKLDKGNDMAIAMLYLCRLVYDEPSKEKLLEEVEELSKFYSFSDKVWFIKAVLLKACKREEEYLLAIESLNVLNPQIASLLENEEFKKANTAYFALLQSKK